MEVMATHWKTQGHEKQIYLELQNSRLGVQNPWLWSKFINLKGSGKDWNWNSYSCLDVKGTQRKYDSCPQSLASQSLIRHKTRGWLEDRTCKYLTKMYFWRWNWKIIWCWSWNQTRILQNYIACIQIFPIFYFCRMNVYIKVKTTSKFGTEGVYFSCIVDYSYCLTSIH
jgi:hypothetical protein